MASYAPLTNAEACVLNTSEGPINYWVMFPEGYSEEYSRAEGNSTTVTILVAWDDAATFKRYALGFTTGFVDHDKFYRNLPLECPWAVNQWCSKLRAMDVGNFADSETGIGTTFEQDFTLQNWPRAGWVKYSATFVSLNYKLLNDNDVAELNRTDAAELGRYVRRTERVLPKERRVPGYTFETDEGTPRPVAEVGFFGTYEKELVYTWLEIPADLTPEYEDVLVKVNDDEFDGYPAETLLFKGVAGEQQPYVGPNGELYFDVPYLFSYREQGWNKFPVGFDSAGGPAFIRIRQKEAATGTKPPYKKASFNKLFKPRSTL
jgi:hypothetical protein